MPGETDPQRIERENRVFELIRFWRVSALASVGIMIPFFVRVEPSWYGWLVATLSVLLGFHLFLILATMYLLKTLVKREHPW
jgi:hypothetical protein